MKTCQNCGRLNADALTKCVSCGGSLMASASGAWGGKPVGAALFSGRVPALLVLATWVLGVVWLYAEHMRGTAYERRCGELQAAVSAQEARAAEAEGRLRKDEVGRDSLGREVALLRNENRRLHQELEDAATEKRRLESRIDQLAAELASYRAQRVLSPATVNEGPLPSDYRLSSGYAIQPLYGKGSGVLAVENKGGADVIIKLVRPAYRQCTAMFYVRSGETFPQAGIPEGSYTLYYATGYDYDYGSRDFKRGRQAKKSDSAFEFNRGTKITYTIGAAFGNATSSQVSGSEFDSFKPTQ